MARQSKTGLFSSLEAQILMMLLLRPKGEWYRSELARELRLSPSSLQRPLDRLARAGIVTTRPDGNRTYYSVDPGHPALPELKGLIAKTSGIAGVIRDELSSVAKRIRCAFVYGSIASGDEVATSDVDLFIIGDVALSSLASSLRKAARAIGREINPTIYTPNEFLAKSRARSGFIRGVLEKPKLFVIGNADDLETITRG